MKIRDYFKPKGAGFSAVQTAREALPGFGGGHWDFDAQRAVYRQLRESVPLLDAAIGKIVRLTGGFRLTSPDRAAASALSVLQRDIQVGVAGRGLTQFADGYLDELLAYGTAVAEMVPDESGRLAALYQANLKDIELKRADNPLTCEICVRAPGGSVPAPRQELLLLAQHAPEPGALYGTSLLRGLPFVAETLLKIFRTIGSNWERAGNLRFAVTYRPSEDSLDRAYAKERAEQIAREWGEAMRDAASGRIRDFVSVGDVDIKVIGAEHQVLDSSVPVRQMLEQMVAKVGLPPFMLGLSWSTTERMSAEQADTLTSELEAYRRLLTPVLLKIGRFFLAGERLSAPLSVAWDTINLQDEVETARAELMRAQARKLTGADGVSGIRGQE